MIKYLKNISLRLFFVLLGISSLLTAWAWFKHSSYISLLIIINLLVLFALAFWLAQSINRIRHYAQAMAENRLATPPQFGDSYLHCLVNAITHLRNELNHQQHIENYILGLTHELKTPLTAQTAALELLQDSKLNTEQQQLIARIQRNTLKQQRLITQLLALAKLENSQQLTNIQLIDLNEIIIQAAQESELVRQAKQLSIHLHTTHNTHTLNGDPTLLRQAIDNLLYNAIDFADEGSTIELTIQQNALSITLDIYNQGEHIPDYALARIPQRFYSLPRTNGRRSTGLGLSFVSQIMRLHHGNIYLNNQENGVCARLIFPNLKPL